MNERADWQAYRSFFEEDSRPQGLELLGLSEEEYACAVTDPRTVALPAGQTLVPFLTPLENAFWYNQTYYQKALRALDLDAQRPLWYYDYHDSINKENPEHYRALLDPQISRIAEQGGVLACDYLDEEAGIYEEHLSHLFDRLEITTRDIVAEYDSGGARHFNHAAVVTLADAASARKRPLSITEAYETGKQQGIFADGITAETVIGEADREHVWQYYKTTFDGLTDSDPMCANSPREEFDALLTEARVTKLVERDAGTIVSLCMFGDVRVFPWANQTFFVRRFPDLYEDGRVFFFPGVIRNPESNGDGRRVMAPMGRLLSLAGIERSVLGFVCDKVSEKPVTVIGNWALNRSGVVTDVRPRVNERIFTAWALQA